MIKDPFGDRRGVYEYGNLLQRLKRLHARFECQQNTSNTSASGSRSSAAKHQSLDARTREIMNDAATLDSASGLADTANLDDIFDHDDDDDVESSMDEDENDDADEAQPPADSSVTAKSEQSKEQTSFWARVPYVQISFGYLVSERWYYLFLMINMKIINLTLNLFSFAISLPYNPDIIIIIILSCLAEQLKTKKVCLRLFCRICIINFQAEKGQHKCSRRVSRKA